MENLRKRTEREVNDTRSYAIAGFARDMLTATDSLSRALMVLPAEARQSADATMKSLIEGIEMTERQMQRLLAKLPAAFAEDPDYQHVARLAAEQPVNIVHLI